MEKTAICNYWKNKTCKYMNVPSSCKFAHGDNDITPITCIYGSKCYNNNCIFSHGDICDNRKIEVNISDFIYKNKKIKQNNKNKVKINRNLINKEDGNILRDSKIKCDNIDNYITEDKNSVNNFNTDNITRDNIKSIKIIKKDVLEKNIFIKIDENMELNKLLNYIDEYYIKKIININSILDEKDEKIKELEEYKNKYNKLEKSIELKDKQNGIICDNSDISNEDNFIIDKKYSKYYNLGKIIKENNSVIDNNLILGYFNNKNISMIKNRCNRIYEIINYMKNNNIKCIKSSIRNIFHMKNENFIFNLYNNKFF